MAYPVDIKKHPVTCPYGKRGPLWSDGIHKGVDQGCPVGTTVVAPIDGKVVGVGTAWGAAFGRHQVVIEFKAKRGKLLPAKTYWVILAHMSAASVKVGATVKKGQTIGKSGAEGNVKGPHVHTEVQTKRLWSRAGYINPQFVLDA